MTDTANHDEITRVLDAVALRSHKVGIGRLQAVYVHRDGVQTLRECFGPSLALLPTKLLRWIDEGRGQGDVAEWLRWNTGREQVNVIRSASDARSVFLEMRIRDAAMRGQDFTVAVFGDDGLRAAFARLSPAYTASTQRLANEARRYTRPLVNVSVGQDLSGLQTLLTVPRWIDQVTEALIVREVVLTMDSMVANAASLLQNRDRLRLCLDGYKEDQRERWDFEGCYAILNLVASTAPWWPWVVKRDQFLTWAACAVKHGPTRHLADGSISLGLDARSTRTFIEDTAVQLGSLVADRRGGVDAQLLAAMQETMSHLSCRLADMQDLDGQVTAGNVALQPTRAKQPGAQQSRTPSGAPQQGLAQPNEARVAEAVLSGAVKHIGIVIDRSSEGRAMVERMRQGPPAFRSRVASPSFKSWEASSHDVLIIFGAVDGGRGFMLPCNYAERGVEEAIRQCIVEAQKTGGLCTWLVSVAPEMNDRVEAALEAIQAAAVLDSFDSAEKPRILH